MEKRILVVDDDAQLTDLLVEYLTKLHIQTLTAALPSVAMKILEREKVDLIILDIMLPEKNGLDVCREIRRTSNVPILMLTGRGKVPDRVEGLNAGADDYLLKPFEPTELVARMETIWRRSGFIQEKTKSLKVKDLEIFFAARQATLRGTELELTQTEFDILVFLVENPGVVFHRDEISAKVAPGDAQNQSRTIDVLLSRLRSKLKDDPKEPTYIKTIRGSGYLFVGRVEGP